MTTNYPEALDDETKLPDITGWDQSGHNVQTQEYDENRVHSTFLGTLRTAILALEAKLGAAASSPLANRVLRGTAAGVTEWVAESVIPATNWGRGAGTAGQALLVKQDESGLEFSSALASAADLAAHEADSTNIHGIADTAALETVTGAQTKVDTHNADTTAVHGIADTSVLETQAGAQAKVDAAIAALVDSSPTTLDTLNELAAALGDDPNFAATTAASIGAAQQAADDAQTSADNAQSDIDAHEALTTGVHGIVDTADLVVSQDITDLRQESGYVFYADDQYTVGSPLAVSANTDTRITNNGGALTKTDQAPAGVTLYDPTADTNQGLIGGEEDDLLAVTIEMLVDPSVADMYIEAWLELSDGTELRRRIAASFPKGANVVAGASFTTEVFVRALHATNGLRVFVRSSNSCDVYGITYLIQRVHKGR